MPNILDETPILRGLIDSDRQDDPLEVGFVQDEAKSTSVLRATVFLEDAINFRSIFHKTDKLALLVYRCYYSQLVKK